MTSAAVRERAGGEQEAARVAKLFERHGRMVYGVCRAMLRDTHEAEDATQQTFLSAHRALLGGARVRDDGAWLATIARNECRARITAGMRRPLSLGDDDLALIADPGDEMQRRLQAEAFRNALADLPERQREAVVLRDLYGLRYGEVARALGLSRPATEALLFRARRAMRQRLRPLVTTALVVPLSIQEGLAQALPGFAVVGSGGVAASVAGGGVLAKLAAGPVGVKVATAAVAVTTVGAVGSVESQRAGRDRAEQPAIVSVDGALSEDDFRSDASGPGSGRSGGEARDDDGNSGSGSREDGVDDDSSGSGSTGEKDDRDGGSSGSGGGGDDDSSGGSGSGTDDEPSAQDSDESGSGSGGSAGEDDSGSSGRDPDDSPDPEHDSEGDKDSSGPSSSSGSSSGSGSGDADSHEEDSSGSGSGSSGSSGSSGKGSGDDPEH